MSKITVIITLYNVEKFVHRAVSSIMNQTYRDLEILCVNDGSTDGTRAIVAALAAQDDRIIIIDQPNSGCAAGAINTGLDHATGDSIYILDGDDDMSLDAIAKMKQRQDETDADFVICDKRIIFPDAPHKDWTFAGVTEKPGRTNAVIDRSVILTGREAVPMTLVTWQITTKGLYRRHLFDGLRYNANGTNGDEFTGRVLLMKANKIAFSDGEYRYYQHGESITRKLSTRYFDKFRCEDDLHQLMVDHGVDDKHIKLFQKYRIKKIANYQFVYAREKHNLSVAERHAIEAMFKTALRDWWANVKGVSLYLKGKYLFNYLKRRYRRKP